MSSCVASDKTKPLLLSLSVTLLCVYHNLQNTFFRSTSSLINLVLYSYLVTVRYLFLQNFTIFLYNDNVSFVISNISDVIHIPITVFNRLFRHLTVPKKEKYWKKWFRVNNLIWCEKTAIWLADPSGSTLVIFDNLGWYCDIDSIFIR